jgi:aminoglycoside 6'-N-acetyltransferase
VALRLRPMREEDLPAVEAWLRRPHVARWWTPETTAEAVIAQYLQRIRGERDTQTILLMVTEGGGAIGWCQWYRWADYPAEAAAMKARDREIGIDYAIGDPSRIGRGLGSRLIAALVTEVRRRVPGAGLLVGPEAENSASRRVLEKNGFKLVAVRPVETEPNDRPIAIYRLPATGKRSAGAAHAQSSRT